MGPECSACHSKVWQNYAVTHPDRVFRSHTHMHSFESKQQKAHNGNVIRASCCVVSTRSQGASIHFESVWLNPNENNKVWNYDVRLLFVRCAFTEVDGSHTALPTALHRSHDTVRTAKCKWWATQRCNSGTSALTLSQRKINDTKRRANKICGAHFVHS